MRFLNVPVTSVMTSNPVTANPDQKLVYIKHIFEGKNVHHHIPVVESDKLVGIVSLTDFLYAIRGATLDDNDAPYQKLYVKDVMRSRPVVMDSSVSLEDVAKILAKGDVHAVLISDDAKLKGIVSTTDVIRYVLGSEKNK